VTDLLDAIDLAAALLRRDDDLSVRAIGDWLARHATGGEPGDLFEALGVAARAGEGGEPAPGGHRQGYVLGSFEARGPRARREADDADNIKTSYGILKSTAVEYTRS